MSINSNNTQQAFWIALGSLFTFGFGILSSMILSRYFNKADYGTYQQVLYVYATLSTVFTLGLPKAFSYFLPRVEIYKAKSLIKKITNLFFILGGIFSLILFFCSPFIAEILNNPDLAFALKIFSPVPLLMLPTMGLEGILSTFRKTKFIAVYTIFSRIIMLSCVALPVLFFGGSYIQAIIGFTVASFISFLLALYLQYLPLKGESNHKPCDNSYREIFRFSLPLLYASLWGTIILSVDQFFISRYFGNQVFAEFSNGALELPFIGMIVGATSSVLSPIFSKMSHQNLNPRKEILPIWISVFKKSAMLIYPLVIYTWFFADVIMIVLYGEKYEVSSVYFRIKSTVNFFSIIVYAPLIINIGKVKYYANVHMYGAIILVILEYLSLLIYKSPYVIISISVICQIGRIFFMLKLVSKFFNLKIYQLFPIKLICQIVLPSLIFLAAEYYILNTFFNFNKILLLFLSFIIYLLAYCIYSFMIKLDYFDIVKPLLNRNKEI